jgi:hypothetical protein
MVGLQPRTWGKLALGALIIGGTLAALWAAYGPLIPSAFDSDPPDRPPVLHRSAGVVVVRFAGAARVQRSEITCDGRNRRATGFWARDPAEACDALASTRAALLSGGGCARLAPSRLRLHAVGHFGDVRFDHQAQKGGCPDPDVWLRVNALAAPLTPPDRKIVGPPPQ